MALQDARDSVDALPTADKVSLLAESMRKLPSKEQRQVVQQGLSKPGRDANDLIWVIIVFGVVAAMLIAVGSFYWNTGDVNKMLAVFTATIGFIAGLITPSPISKGGEG
jgi:hypothetical protein